MLSAAPAATAQVLPSPFAAPGPARPLSVRPCPEPPPALRDLESAPFYTDGAFSIPDPARLAADTAASRPLAQFLDAVQRPTERWVALRDPEEAACGIRLIEAWAGQRALLGSFNRQGGYHRKWTLAGVAIAWLALRDAPAATPERRALIGAWLADVARAVQPPYGRPPPRPGGPASEVLNNHAAWAGLAVAAAGLGAGDAALLRWGMQRAEAFLAQVTPEGAHPQELARGRMALHYHLFALQPAAALARIGAAGGAPLSVPAQDALARFASFTFAATEDSARIAALAGAPQAHLSGERPWRADGQGFEILRDPAFLPALAAFRPYRARWLGGNVTLLWGG
jgi:poly(beta-D-mannuronate) lyase